MTPAQRRQIIRFMGKFPRLTYSDIARRMGIPRGTLSTWACQLRCEGVIARRNKTGRVRVPTAETLARLAAAAVARKKGKSWAVIARESGISRQAVYYYIARHAPEMLERGA
jgi:transposase-like protein